MWHKKVLVTSVDAAKEILLPLIVLPHKGHDMPNS